MTELRERLRRWAAKAAGSGWLEAGDLERLERVEAQRAETLFQGAAERPLIVAFFGGTGVGKSSLLNRLAGQPIARVGVERPTSREVTLYLHRDRELAELPPELPLEETRIAWHDDQRRRDLAWLDLPDIDSVEQRHRELVEAWLPYVDWLVYVVSPERYQDERGWRLVQRRGGRHAWLFVINQWDLGGMPEQIDAFASRLREAGFTDPVILRTSCRDDAGEDDFPRLEQTIARAIDEHGMASLQRLADQARERELALVGRGYLVPLEALAAPDLERAWRELVTDHLTALQEELDAAGRLVVAAVAARDTPWWRRRRVAVPELDDPQALLERLWSGRADTRLQDLALDLERLLLERRVAIGPFREPLERFRERGREWFQRAALPVVMEGLARPGGPFARGWRRLLRELGWLLPLGAAGWVGYHLIHAFYLGTTGGGRFLGIDFAIHSLLLIGLAWFVPWLLELKATPGAAATVEGALQRGAEAGVAALEQRLDGLLVARREAAAILARELEGVLEEVASSDPKAPAGLAGRLTATAGKDLENISEM